MGIDLDIIYSSPILIYINIFRKTKQYDINKLNIGSFKAAADNKKQPYCFTPVDNVNNACL